MLSFAEMYSCEKLVQKCLQLIKQRFPIMTESTEFLHLSRVRLEEILSFTDLQLGEALCVCVRVCVCVCDVFVCACIFICVSVGLLVFLS